MCVCGESVSMRRRLMTRSQEKVLPGLSFSSHARRNMGYLLRLLLLLLLLFLLCWLMGYTLHEKKFQHKAPNMIAKGVQAPADVTIILPTLIDAKKTFQQWLLPSSNVSNVLCAWDTVDSTPLPRVSVVVVQMASPYERENGMLRASMLALAAQFPEREVVFESGSLDDDDDGRPWNAWRFTSRGSTSHSCVREAALVVLPTARPGSPVGYDAFHRYVRAALSALPYRTKYFLVIADFLVPTVLAERRLHEEGFQHRGFLQRLLSATRYNEGRVAAVQCTIVSKRPLPLDDNASHAEGDTVTEVEQEWQHFSMGLPPPPMILHNSLERNNTHLSAYIALDKGALVGYGANWNQTVSGQFLTRHLNGYNAFDDRVWMMDESVDAASPFCTLYNREVYDAVGGFSASVWQQEQEPLQRRMSPTVMGTMGWSLLRDTPPPDDPENGNIIIRSLMLQNNFPTLWPDTLQADDFIGWELSFRVKAAFPEWQVWSSTAMAVAWATPMDLVSRTLGVKPPFQTIRPKRGQYILHYYAPSFVMSEAFSKQWGAFAAELFRSRLVVPLFHQGNVSEISANQHNLPLVELRILSNYGVMRCSGMMIEGMHHIIPLQRRLMVSFWGFRSPWCPGVPQGAMDALQRTQMGVNRWGFLAAWRQKKLDERYDVDGPSVGTTIEAAGHRVGDRESFVRVSLLHHGSKYVSYLAIVRPLSDYNIARILSETSRLKAEDVVKINTHADEVWVTSDFFKEVYRRSGVREELLHVIPESVDPHIIKPDLCTPFDAPPELELKGGNGKTKSFWTNHPDSYASATHGRKRFRFLSVFKWEPRKGWDVLLSAYWKAFGPGTPLHDNVSLYIKTSFPWPFSGNVTLGNMGETLTHWATHVARLPNFTSLQQFPHLVIIHSPLSRIEDMCRLYRSSDAFVLPTRGEGWGIPTIEAMAMELPVLTTNWAGSTAFCTRHNSFLIPVDGLEEIPTGGVYDTFSGCKWAMPSIEWTAQLMGYVVSHPENAKAVGRRAREDVVRRFSEEAVADAAIERLRHIAHEVSRRRSSLFSWAKMVLG